MTKGAGLDEPFLLDGPLGRPWWRALSELDAALEGRDEPQARRAYAAVVRALVREGSPDLASALADAVLFGEGAWSEVVAARGGAAAAAAEPWPSGARAAGRADLEAYAALLRRDAAAEASALLGGTLPPWQDLAPARPDTAAERARARLAACLARGDADGAWSVVAEAARQLGAGPLARFEAYAWGGADLEGVEAPAAADLGSLVGLERQLERLTGNVEAFLDDRPALATLLYGPRGSGKSTAVRGLLPRYRERGLRLVELPGDALGALPTVLAALRRRPHHHVLYLDDLGVDDDDGRLRPLKSLLDGSLRARPPRVLVVATSNRRHLLRQRFGDRPSPEDDDVHAWDTHQDALALADRFGLTITFPLSDRRAYLDIVRSLVRAEGVVVEEPDELDERALRFASWGNGLSGRTARQFVDTLVRADGVAPEAP